MSLICTNKQPAGNRALMAAAVSSRLHANLRLLSRRPSLAGTAASGMWHVRQL